MEPTAEPKTVSLTIVRETSTKDLKRKDGKPYVLHNVVAKGNKGEFPAVMFLDQGEPIALNETRTYKISKAKNGNEWVLSEVKGKATGGFAPTRAGQEIHAASMIVAKDLLLAGKIGTVEDMLRLSRELAEKTLAHWRANR